MITTLLLTEQGLGQSVLALASIMLLGLGMEIVGLRCHHQAMDGAEHEGAASHYIQRTTFGNTYLLRNGLLGVTALLLLTLMAIEAGSTLGLMAWLGAGALLLLTAVIGRALFYVLVVPTTMPGAFFWKNKGFEEHAKDIGLANMPQVGVVPDAH